MELELDFRFKSGPHWAWLLAGLAALLLVLLGGLGWSVTPTTAAGAPRLLTWEDWQANKVRRQAAAELGQLRRECDGLAALLQDAPDPVRAGLALARVQQLAAAGSPLLAEQRQALLAAAEAVNSWAAGAETQPAAAEALAQAAAALENEP